MLLTMGLLKIQN